MGAAMALHAVAEIGYALFGVFALNLGLCVFMAAVTGKAGEVTLDVAGFTGGVVVLVQHKKLVVVESRWLPGHRAVALQAVGADLPVQGVRRFLMATLAFVLNLCTQHGV